LLAKMLVSLCIKTHVGVSCLLVRCILFAIWVEVLIVLSIRDIEYATEVDCVSPRCREQVFDKTELETTMCFFAKPAHDSMHDDTSMQCPPMGEVQSTCTKGEVGIKEVLSNAFADRGCQKGDLCSAAAARLGVFLTACCFCPSIVEKLHDTAKIDDLTQKCVSLADSFGGKQTIIQLLKSLQCGCEMLSGLESSNSGAVIQRSLDYHYIIKEIPKKHAATYKTIMFPGDIPIINQILYADQNKNVIIMRNGLHAGTFPSLPSQCTIRTMATWDIKPPGCNAAQRYKFLTELVQKQIKLNEWKNFEQVKQEIKTATVFFKKNNLVDYSLLIGEFQVDCDSTQQAQVSIDTPATTQCIFSPENWKYKTALCVSFIDYLMEFSWDRIFENVFVAPVKNVVRTGGRALIDNCGKFKLNKWTNYDKKHQHMWDCMGDLTQDSVFCKCLLGEGCQNDEGNPWCSASVKQQ